MCAAESQKENSTEKSQAEAESGRSSLPPALATQPGSQTDISLMEVSSVKRGRAIFEKMSSGNGQTTNTEGGGCKAVGGLPKESPPNTGNTLMEFQENVSLKDRMALYQAAVSKAENSNRFANTSEEIKSCTVPGGLAAVMKHFENGQMTPSMTTFAHSQHQRKAAEETSATTQLPLSSSTREAECSATATKEAPLEAFQTPE
ncbi:xin actin-binding repeat-containing protein 2-like isoform X4 [Cygnus olor]|uniref:xin actin-binding repeat-containing protein 2-like isoform X4 n=1 Tax=Cygnus olor TaxID=8869 RepID=UPI001ADE4F34|nr:xin actin-binding repeat-containing protein 2-like isoform X4 [Cygnus olor]XP_040409258.1 xin actin-binding repeat-containing protein 2-like isoform X4 [Cygnus olor]